MQITFGWVRNSCALSSSMPPVGHSFSPARGGATGHHRDRCLRQRLGQRRRGAGGDQEIGAQLDAALHLFDIEYGAHAHRDVRQVALERHQRIQRRRRAQGQFDRAQSATQQGRRQPARLVDAVRGDHRQDAGALQQLFGLGLGIGDAHGAWVPCVFVRTPILTDAPRANVSVAAASNLSISREPGFA